ncbi:MAG: hypothetical protein ACP5MG_00580 [Verrucomicrobiia bacterium]|jgi:hypothetical protein
MEKRISGNRAEILGLINPLILAILLGLFILRGNSNGGEGDNRSVFMKLPEIGSIAPQIEAREINEVESKEFTLNRGRYYILVFIPANDPRLSDLCNEILKVSKKYEGSALDVIILFERELLQIKEVAEKLAKIGRIKVLIDESSGKTFKRYGMSRLNRDFSVLIDTARRVVWYGDPFSGMSDAIENLLSGKIEIDRLRKSFLLKKTADEYFLLAKERGTIKTNRIVELGEQILKEGADDPLLLNEFAWNIMTEENLRYRDLMLALRAARKACDAVKGTQPAMLDTYARALFLNGQIKDAIQIQRLAIELTTDTTLRKKLQETLKIYQSSVPKQ